MLVLILQPVIEGILALGEKKHTGTEEARAKVFLLVTKGIVGFLLPIEKK